MDSQDAARYETIAQTVEYEEEMEAIKAPGVECPASLAGSAGLDVNETLEPMLPTRRMFTKNLLLILFTSLVQECHLNIVLVAMPNLLSLPVSTEDEELERALPLRFSGGAGFKPSSLSCYTAIFGKSLSP